MLQQLNGLITKITTIVLYPFALLGEFWEILFLSILASLVVLVAYKLISSPRLIKQTTNQIKSSILAIRLYKDFSKVILTSFAKSLYYTGKYFVLNLFPIFVIILVLFPLFVQMDIRYGMRPFEVGEAFLVKAEFKGNVFDREIKLLENPSYKAIMNPVYINAFTDEEQTKPMREVNWKLEVTKGESTALAIEVNGVTYKKTLQIGSFKGPLSNKKFSRSSWAHFLYPAEDLFKSDREITSITIKYPGRNVNFLGLKAHWLIYNIILVLILVLAFRKKFGVEFY